MEDAREGVGFKGITAVDLNMTSNDIIYINAYDGFVSEADPDAPASAAWKNSRA